MSRRAPARCPPAQSSHVFVPVTAISLHSRTTAVMRRLRHQPRGSSRISTRPSTPWTMTTTRLCLGAFSHSCLWPFGHPTRAELQKRERSESSEVGLSALSVLRSYATLRVTFVRSNWVRFLSRMQRTRTHSIEGQIAARCVNKVRSRHSNPQTVSMWFG